jgi:flagellar biosynthesis protein
MKKKHTDKLRAIALKYIEAEDPAPRVVARGEGLLAEKIICLAGESGVPVRKNDLLAEALFSLAPGDVIPEALYLAVAEILAVIIHYDRVLTEKDVL